VSVLALLVTVYLLAWGLGCLLGWLVERRWG